MRILKAFLPVLVVSLIAASSADAAQRFVCVGGSGTTCSSGTPCSIEEGINSAPPGDEVIVASGTYTTSTVLQGTDLDVHGPLGGTRPVINSTALSGLGIFGGTAEARDLVIRHAGPFAAFNAFATSVTVERVDVRSSVGGPACSVGIDAVFRDSLCVNTATNGIAFSREYSGGTSSAKLRNVTLVAEGPGGRGAFIDTSGGGVNSVDMKNVIVQGPLRDVDVRTMDAGTFSPVTLSNSNFDSVLTTGAGATVSAVGSPTNQTTAPMFTDTTSYHQAADSPTINSGAADPDLGTTDLDGDPRTIGSAPDIGVDESVQTTTPPTGDTTPPETTISKGPKKKTKSKKATFVFSSNEAGSTFTCALDKGPAKPCVSPLKLKRVTKGKHKLIVVATDAAGNADATAATYGWKVKKKPRKR